MKKINKSIVCIGFLLFVLIWWRWNIVLKKDFDPLRKLYNQQIETTVTVESIKRDYARTRLIVSHELWSGRKVELIVEPVYDFSIGDEVNIRGVFQEVEDFIDPEGRIIPIKIQKSIKNIYGRFYLPKIINISRGKNLSLFKLLKQTRFNFSLVLEKLFPLDRARLISGMLFGANDELSQDIYEALKNTGLLHIVVLSGQNISYVIAAISQTTAFLSRRWRIVTNASVIILFLIFADAGSSGLRAGIMVMVDLVAQFFYRKYEPYRGLVVSAVIAFFINPLFITHDLSFQLSFLATLAIVFISPRILTLLTWIRWRSVKETVSVTLATQIAILPISIVIFRQISPFSIFANVIILPTIPFLMLGGFISGLVGAISTEMGLFFAWPISVTIKYVFKIVDFIGSFPVIRL